jgi:hypothetical protein
MGEGVDEPQRDHAAVTEQTSQLLKPNGFSGLQANELRGRDVPSSAIEAGDTASTE